MMINIPFNEWSKQRLRDGRKSCTSRKKKCGVLGDLFKVDGTTYRITKIEQRPLGYVAIRLRHQEGADNSVEFLQVWRDIYPNVKMRLTDMVYVHFFEEETKS